MKRLTRATCFARHGQTASACGMGRNLAWLDRVIRHDRANMSTQKKKNKQVQTIGPDRDRIEDRRKA